MKNEYEIVMEINSKFENELKVKISIRKSENKSWINVIKVSGDLVKFYEFYLGLRRDLFDKL